MNGKHPIDELFAQGLRDAEAQPPPAVWEGILRERQRSKGARARHLRRWGFAAILLLLLAGTSYWTMQRNSTSPVLAEQLIGSSTQAGTERSIPASVEEDHTPDKARPDQGASVHSEAPAAPEALAETRVARDVPAEQAHAGATGIEQNAGKRRAGGSTVEHVVPAGAGLAASGGKTGRSDGTTSRDNAAPVTEARRGEQGGEPTWSGEVTDAGMLSAHSANNANSSSEPGQEERPRSTPDVHLSELTTLPTPMVSTAAVIGPGPLLSGDSVPHYLLSRGHLWFALQAEMVSLNGEWKGTGTEIQDLNTSETWRGGQGLSMVAGYEWLNGWSIGLGLGVMRQRSRFLHHEVQSGTTETVIDTTWTSNAMGPVTNYTWDIIETTLVEPGVEQDYNATNTYTQLRIAPELAYRLKDMKRFSVHGRIAPIFLVDIGRNGNTLTNGTGENSSDTLTTRSVVIPLADASLDDRFPLRTALSAGLDLRYQLCERWSIAASPTCTWWLPRATDPTPTLSMTEWGASVRLRYDLRHKERRVK